MTRRNSQTADADAQAQDVAQDSPAAAPAANEQKVQPSYAERIRAGDKLSDAELYDLIHGDDYRNGDIYERKYWWQIHEFKHGEQVVHSIPLSPGEEISVHPQTGEELFPMQFVSINGVNVRIPKGTAVEMPKAIFELVQKQAAAHRRASTGNVPRNILQSHTQSNTDIPRVQLPF